MATNKSWEDVRDQVSELECQEAHLRNNAISLRQQAFYSHLRAHLNPKKLRSRGALERLWETLVNAEWTIKDTWGVFSLSFRVAGHLCAEFKYGERYDVGSYQYTDFSLGSSNKPLDAKTLEMLKDIGVKLVQAFGREEAEEKEESKKKRARKE